jgi:small subunit ribosomal protein S16
MAVKIRLTRAGKKKKPFYRVVVADSKTPRDGKVLDSLGFYDPTKEPLYFEVNAERVQYWLSVGAQPSGAAERLLGNAGLLPAVKRESALQGVARKDRKKES